MAIKRGTKKTKIRGENKVRDEFWREKGRVRREREGEIRRETRRLEGRGREKQPEAAANPSRRRRG